MEWNYKRQNIGDEVHMKTMKIEDTQTSTYSTQNVFKFQEIEINRHLYF